MTSLNFGREPGLSALELPVQDTNTDEALTQDTAQAAVAHSVAERFASNRMALNKPNPDILLIRLRNPLTSGWIW